MTTSRWRTPAPSKFAERRSATLAVAAAAELQLVARCCERGVAKMYRIFTIRPIARTRDRSIARTNTALPVLCRQSLSTFTPILTTKSHPRSCDFTAHVCTAIIHENYKLFVNPVYFNYTYYVNILKVAGDRSDPLQKSTGVRTRTHSAAPLFGACTPPAACATSLGLRGRQSHAAAKDSSQGYPERQRADYSGCGRREGAQATGAGVDAAAAAAQRPPGSSS